MHTPLGSKTPAPGPVAEARLSPPGSHGRGWPGATAHTLLGRGGRSPVLNPTAPHGMCWGPPFIPQISPSGIRRVQPVSSGKSSDGFRKGRRDLGGLPSCLFPSPSHCIHTIPPPTCLHTGVTLSPPNPTRTLWPLSDLWQFCRVGVRLSFEHCPQPPCDAEVAARVQ